MIIPKSHRIIGSKNVQTRVLADGVLVSFGGNISIAPEPPEIADIDLTALTLDPRVTYTGPAHTYFDSNGQFAISAANEWPLEYVNGVAVGRSEPEPESKNYQLDSAFSSISETQQGEDTAWITSQSAGVTVSQPDDGTFFGIETNKPGWELIGVFSEGTGAFIVPATDTPVDNSWTVANRTFTNPSLARIRFYIARLDSQNYVYGRVPDLPVGDYIATVWRELTSEGFVQCRASQIEPGTFSTSPIFNEATAQNTRAASSVTITNPGPATGITVQYSDGNTASISFVNDVATLPLMNQTWGSRYITRISFEV